MRKGRDYNRITGVYAIIGQNVIRLRGKLTQDELAKKAGISRMTLGTIERGGPISLENLICLADALGIHPGDLFISEGDRQEVGIKAKLLLEKVSELFNLEKQKE